MKEIIKISVLLLTVPCFAMTLGGCGMMGGDVDEQIEAQEDRIAELEAQFEEELARLQDNARQHNELAREQSCGQGGPDANGNECPPEDGADTAAGQSSDGPEPASADDGDTDMAASDSPPPAS